MELGSHCSCVVISASHGPSGCSSLGPLYMALRWLLIASFDQVKQPDRFWPRSCWSTWRNWPEKLPSSWLSLSASSCGTLLSAGTRVVSLGLLSCLLGRLAQFPLLYCPASSTAEALPWGAGSSLLCCSEHTVCRWYGLGCLSSKSASCDVHHGHRIQLIIHPFTNILKKTLMHRHSWFGASHFSTSEKDFREAFQGSDSQVQIFAILFAYKGS